MPYVYAVTQRITWICTKVAMKLLYRFSVRNIEYIHDIQKPLMIVSNHRCYWDSMILGTIFPFFSRNIFPMGYIAADEFFTYFFHNIYLRSMGVSKAHKGKGLDVSLRDFKRILARRGVVSIFPFGKRIWDDNIRPIPGRGAATLIKEFPDLTILPVYLNTTSIRTWKDWFRRHTMEVIIGKPYKIDNAQNKTIDELSNTIVDSFLTLR